MRFRTILSITLGQTWAVHSHTLAQPWFFLLIFELTPWMLREGSSLVAHTDPNQMRARSEPPTPLWHCPRGKSITFKYMGQLNYKWPILARSGACFHVSFGPYPGNVLVCVLVSACVVYWCFTCQPGVRLWVSCGVCWQGFGFKDGLSFTISLVSGLQALCATLSDIKL